MNLSDYKEKKPRFLLRCVWYIVNLFLFRTLRGRLFSGFRKVLLRTFGAKVDKDAYIYATCRVYAPWNLEVGRACLGPGVELYNKSKICIGDDCVVSQRSFLCTASHDVSSLMLPLLQSPITLKDNSWVAAEAFVGPGVTIGEGAVVGARAAVFRDVEPWSVVGGNPARFIKKRKIYGEG